MRLLMLVDLITAWARNNKPSWMGGVMAGADVCSGETSTACTSRSSFNVFSAASHIHTKQCLTAVLCVGSFFRSICASGRCMGLYERLLWPQEV